MRKRGNLYMAMPLAICCWISVLAVSAYAEEAGDVCNDITKAKELFTKGQYFASLDIERKCAAEVLYLIWLNERQLGIRVDPIAMTDEKSPNRMFYDYVKRHMEYFSYDEAHGNFATSDKRLKEIQRLNPNSPLIAKIKFHIISDLDQMAWEDGDPGSALNILIKRYEQFINTYPNSELVVKATKRVRELQDFARTRGIKVRNKAKE